MRPKFILTILLAGVLAVGAIIFLKQHSSAPVPNVAPAPAVSSAPTPEPAPAPAPVVTKTLTPEERQADIDAETDRLSAWAMTDDPQSLSNILAQLTNPNEDIREAAIEAAKQFGSTNAIPALKAAADATDDLQEKIAYLEAADFLSVPQAEITRATGTTPTTP